MATERNPGRVLADSDADREGWLATRRRYFTGSEVATLIGRHEYTDLASVLKEKRTGVSDFEGGDHVTQGLLSEGFVAAYAMDTFPGLKLEPCGKLMEDPGCAKLAATPDFFAEDATVLGCPGPANFQLKFTKAGSVAAKDGQPLDCPQPGWAKTKGYKWGSGEPGTLPSYIWHQVQLEAAVLDVPTSFVVAYHRLAFPGWGSKGDVQIRVYRVDRSEKALTGLRIKARETEIVNE